MIRETEFGDSARVCGSVVGYYANSIYLGCLVQDVPTGWAGTLDYVRRLAENDFRPVKSK